MKFKRVFAEQTLTDVGDEQDALKINKCLSDKRDCGFVVWPVWLNDTLDVKGGASDLTYRVMKKQNKRYLS